MSNLTNSRTLRNTLNQWSQQDQIVYDLEYHKDAYSYRFIARKTIKGEPIVYKVFATAEALESAGPVSALDKLRQRAVVKLMEVAHQ